jgi:hypothetical protein
MRYSKNMNPCFLSMRALQETNGAEGGDGVIEVVNGKTLEINGKTYNALAIAGIIVAGIIFLYMMFSIVCRKQKTVEDLRLTHVRTGIARGLIGFTFVSIILSAVIMVLAAQGSLDNPKYEAQWLAHGGSINWCEVTNPHYLIKNSANTMSNVCFVIAGVVMIGLSIEDARALRLAQQNENDADAVAYYKTSYPSANVGILRLPSVSILWGATSIYLGVASGVYHAQLVQFWGYMDVASLYAVLAVPVLYDLMGLTPWNKGPIFISEILLYLLEAAVVVLSCSAAYSKRDVSVQSRA